MDLYLAGFLILSFVATVTFFHFVIGTGTWAVSRVSADLDLPLAIAGILVARTVLGFMEPFTEGSHPLINTPELWFFGILSAVFTPFVLLWLWFILLAVWEYGVKPITGTFWDTPFWM